MSSDKEREPLSMSPDQLADKRHPASEMKYKLRDAATKLQERGLFREIQTDDSTHTIQPLLGLGENPGYPDRHYYLSTEGVLLDIPSSKDGRLLLNEKREVEGDDIEVIRVGQIALDAVEARVNAQKLDLLDE